MASEASASAPATRGKPVEFFDRYSGEVQRESIYGEKFLRWICETTSGKISVELVAKRAFFSRWYGRRMSQPKSVERIRPFIAEYGLDENEFADPVDSYGSFNEFFFRKLKPEARPIDAEEKAIVFPADGRHLGIADVSKCDGFWAKGQRLEIPELLGGDAELVERFANGSAVISRLCPVDYHRFHFCAAGVPGETRLINGPLYSVNPIALRHNVGILAENKRVLTRLGTQEVGEVLILEIGATNVGSIVQTYTPGGAVAKGDEKGCFEFGGSMTMLLFESGRLQLADDLLEQSAQQRELYAHVGDRLGVIL
jgi:phosphatidylserine decarboxylase